MRQNVREQQPAIHLSRCDLTSKHVKEPTFVMVTRASGFSILSPSEQMEQLLFADTTGEEAGCGANVTAGAVLREQPHLLAS
jgi:hypothetical protein